MFGKPTAYLLLLGPFLFSNTSYSDLGTVRSIDPNTLPTPTNPPTAESMDPLNSSITFQELPLTRTYLDRPWNLDTPAGPTAFVLDQRKLEIGITLDRLSQLLGVYDALLGVKFGLTDAFTADGSIGTQLFTFGVRWNFLNRAQWAYAIRPWVGITHSNSNDSSPYYYSSSSGNSPLALEISASKVIDDEHRLHFSLEGGRNTTGSSYGYSSIAYSSNGTTVYDNYQSTSNTNTYALRLAAAYELRLSLRSGMTFWIAPEFISKGGSNSSTGTYSLGTHSNTSEKGIKLGVGYHYWREHFGTSIGLALGPNWRSVQDDYGYSSYSNSPSSNSYSSFSPIEGAITGGINYRL